MAAATLPRPVEVPMWRAMASADRPLTLAEIAQRTAAATISVRFRLRCWLNAGLVARIDGTEPSYTMTDMADRGAPPPHTTYAGDTRPRERSDRERLWTAMRVLKSFDAPALKMSANASDRSVATFLNALQRAGYVEVTHRGSAKMGRWARYRLLHNTGRHAPKISHHVAVDGARRVELVDRNTSTRIDISPRSVSLRRKSEAPSDGGGVS